MAASQRLHGLINFGADARMQAAAAEMKIIADDNWIAELPVSVRHALEERMTVIDVTAGEAVAVAGKAVARMFQVVTGCVRINGIHPNGDEALLTIYIPGNTFGETALIARRPHNHTSIALVDSRLRVLSDANFWDLYAAHREIADAVCRRLVGLISRQVRAREARATFSLGDCIAMVFENFVRYCPGPATARGVAIGFPFTQSDLAMLLDVTRQSVHREISKLRLRGAIDKHDGRWTVVDPKQLRR